MRLGATNLLWYDWASRKTRASMLKRVMRWWAAGLVLALFLQCEWGQPKDPRRGVKSMSAMMGTRAGRCARCPWFWCFSFFPLFSVGDPLQMAAVAIAVAVAVALLCRGVMAVLCSGRIMGGAPRPGARLCRLCSRLCRLCLLLRFLLLLSFFESRIVFDCRREI